jgi:hypothetical protein
MRSQLFFVFLCLFLLCSIFFVFSADLICLLPWPLLGPDDAPTQYNCTLLPDLSSSRSLTCLTEAQSQGILLRFTVDLNGQILRGNDTVFLFLLCFW